MRNKTRLIVNLNHLESNLNLMRGQCPSNTLIFMVKANAYGHGLIEITNAAYDCGVRMFGVATLFEAVEVRKNCPHINDSEIIVFSDTELDSRDAELYSELKIIPVIHCLQDLKNFLSNSQMTHVPLYLKFNTGMNRLGFNSEDIQEVAGLLKSSKRSVDHLMTHFACSYYIVKNADRTQRQYQSFREIKRMFIDAGVEVLATSVSNSGAIEQGVGLEETHIRPGLMLYGPQSTMTKDRLWEIKNISKFESAPIHSAFYKKGVPIGYGATPLSDDGTLLVLPVGYGDGVLTYYSGAKVKCGELEGRIVGRVNMDLTFVLFKNTREVPNQPVEFWNYDPRSIEALSTELKTIPYQLFTALNERIPRVYKI
jgi:alanine racemase